MAKTKISEFSATPANNTDIDSINIAEGCAPSGINDAIRELMSQLKDFQAGTAGDSFNGPVGTTTAATGAFTNLTASGTLGVTGATTLSSALTYGGVTLSNAVTGTGNMVLSNSPTLVTPALGTPASGVVTNLTGTASININGTVGATTATTGAFTTLAASGAVTLSGGTANGVPYLNGSKVLTSGSALTFDGSNLGLGVTPQSWNASSRALQFGAGGTASLENFNGLTATVYQNAWRNGSNQLVYSTSAPASSFGQFNGAFTWFTAPSGTAGNAISFTQAMTLDASGYLLVGATSTSGAGTSRFQVGDTNSASQMLVKSNTAHAGIYASSAADTYFSWNTSGFLAFGQGPTNGAAFTERARIDSSGNLLVGTTSGSYKVDVSGDVNVTGSYRVNGVATTGLTGGQTGSAPLYGARAWVNFNGTGTVAIRASGNVSSITDNGTGDYTVNFTTAMPDANYSAVGMSMRNSNNSSNLSINGDATYSNGFTTTSVRVQNREDTNVLVDPLAASISIFR